MDLTGLKIRSIWFFQIGITHFFRWIWSIIWNRGFKLCWRRLWIREDEDHPSLSYDPMATRYMNTDQRLAYIKELTRRKGIARGRNLKRYFAEAQ